MLSHTSDHEAEDDIIYADCNPLEKVDFSLSHDNDSNMQAVSVSH